MMRNSIGSKVSTKFFLNINHQVRKYITEGTFIHTIFQLGLNPYAPFSFYFLFCSFLENIYSIGNKLNT